MRINKLILFLATAVVAVACNDKSAMTKVTVKVGENMPGDVRFIVADIDTVVSAKDGIAGFSVPTSPLSLGTVVCGNVATSQFIPDVAAVTVDFTGDMPMLVAGAGSLNEKVQGVEAAIYKLQTESGEKAERLIGDDPALEALADSASKVSVQIFKDALAANTDNAVGLMSLRNIYYELDAAELEATLASLSPALQEDEFVKKVTSAMDAKKKTAEGKMFTDFTVEVDSLVTVKFSDYVGKGKYVLVDFWASWCGPCRREVPNIINVWNKYKGDSFDVLGVAVWDEPDNTKKAIEELGIEYDQIINAQRIPTDIYGIEGIPQIMLFGPDGTILRRDLRGEEIEKAVAASLSAK